MTTDSINVVQTQINIALVGTWRDTPWSDFWVPKLTLMRKNAQFYTVSHLTAIFRDVTPTLNKDW